MVTEADISEKGKEEKYVRLPTFLEKSFFDLKKEVIEKRNCCFCGTCIAVCDKIAVSKKKPEPEFVEEYDTACGMCYTFCPRSFFPLAEIEKWIFGKERKENDTIGIYRNFYVAKSKKSDIIEKAQDSGAVTSLLAYALSKRIIDCAVITGSKEWKPLSKIAKNYEELKEGAGTRYTIYASVAGIKEAIKEGCKNIGFVGLPCQIQGIRKIMTSEEPYEVGEEKISLLIGLFCMKNFKEKLINYITKRCGLKREAIKKLDIKGNKLWIYDNQVYEVPLSSLKKYVNEGCLSCKDFTAELADISVGSVGSEKGWSTIITRTAEGEKLIKGAAVKQYIEIPEKKEIDIEKVKRLAEKKKKKSQV